MTGGIDYLKIARLDGQGIVLLGAGGGGIGPATASALSGAGARLLCVDIKEQEARESALLVGGEAIVADVRKRADMAQVFAREAFIREGFQRRGRCCWHRHACAT